MSGCGNSDAATPNLDRLAGRGMIYTRVWSAGPVCAPARTTIIMRVHSATLAAEHMRGLVPLPPGMHMYPQLLREAGYSCTNNEKEGYNLIQPGRVGDESSGRAHCSNRPPARPFFAIFTHTVTHESQVRKRSHTLIHDPAGVRVPAHHPDSPEVRHDRAQCPRPERHRPSLMCSEGSANAAKWSPTEVGGDSPGILRRAPATTEPQPTSHDIACLPGQGLWVSVCRSRKRVFKVP